MTATIPRPNWPDLRQRASMLVARITGRPVDATIAHDIARQRTLQREEKARQWAAVMTERGGRSSPKTGRATKKAAGPAAAGTQLTETTAQAPAVPVVTARAVAAKRAPAGKRAPLAKVAEPATPPPRPSAPVVAARTATSARPTPVEVPFDSAPWPPVALDDTGPLPRVSAPLAADPPSVRAPIVASAPVMPAAPAAPAPVPVAPAVPAVSAPAVDAPAARAAAAAAAASIATAQAATERSAWLRISTAWVLPVMLTIVCGMTAIWSQASGPAAAGWLVATILTGFFGVPLVLVLMRLFGVDDSSE